MVWKVMLRRMLILLLLLAGTLRPAETMRAASPQTHAAQAGSVTAYDLILAMNTLRVSFGLPALIEDPIINAVAQSTARTMADNQMSWHIGNVRGRLQAAGYGGGAQVFATENFAVGTNMGIDQIMAVWADAEHMRPATTPAYCHVGAGVAKAANGATYYVLQAAYISGQACGDYTSGGGSAGSNGGGSPAGQFIVPVRIATPDADGNIYHVVEFGQSLWAIAIAYQITIADIEFWNNISRESSLQVGQRLFIPDRNTEGYATPTPVGMVIISPPDDNGRIVHEVQPYQTLSTIAAAYQVTVNSLLALNGWQADWPLQIGQKLLIDPGRILSPLEQLTPASDGNYYHTVQSGQTLSGIAALYDLPVSNLMAWNGLTSDSIIVPGQKLLLQVTPPAPPSATPTPATPTPTFTVSLTPTLAPSTFTETPPAPTPNATGLAAPIASTASTEGLFFGGLLTLAGVILLIVLLARNKPEASA